MTNYEAEKWVRSLRHASLFGDALQLTRCARRAHVLLFFRIAEQLGVSTMTVIGTFQPGLVAIPETAESFALLADKARSHGLHCVLEFIPLWGIGDLASAWQILQIANRPNTRS